MILSVRVDSSFLIFLFSLSSLENSKDCSLWIGGKLPLQNLVGIKVFLKLIVLEFGQMEIFG